MSDQNLPSYPDSSTPPSGYGQQTYGAQPPVNPAQDYAVVPFASWWARVGASLLDNLLSFVLLLVPAIIGIIMIVAGVTEDEFGDADGINALGIVGILVLVFGNLAVFAFAIWNQGIRMGRTGQSLGKKWVGIQVVHAETGQFLGGGMGFVRLLVSSVLGNLCFINYLWPLWDDKKQTWHDKVVSSVVIRK